MGLRFLIWGGNGWIGSMLRELLEADDHTVIVAKSRLQDLIGICRELKEIKPDFVLNCAGLTGKPTIDFLEDHKQETYLINTIGTVNLAHACWEARIHMTNYATGCIYAYDETHPMGTKFTELDPPNFQGSTYSCSKIKAEDLLSMYDNVLTLRIRLPVSADMHPKNLIAKLSKYGRVVNIPNSVTILPEMLPISIKMTMARCKGIYNFTNPGVMTWNELLMLYKKYIKEDHKWENFTEEEQNAVLRSKRSNCELDVGKLQAFHPVTDIHEALEKVMKEIALKMKEV
ncbi:RmlD substrate binding domain [uncultured virus]|nr:RmlD substrate binding domain [uncultured virus]